MDLLLGVVGVLAVLFLIAAVIAYVVVRFVLVRSAEHISKEIAARIENLPTENLTTSTRAAVAGINRYAPVASLKETGRAVGSGIVHFADSHGLSLEEGKKAFLRNLDNLARLMDRAVPLPLIGGVGLDALLGLIPVVGDVISAVVATSIVVKSLQFGLPKELVSRMVGNIFVDVLFGAIPFLGDLFDILYKANTRNMNLLRDYLQERERLDAQLNPA